jgi:hypothetical protein
MPVGPGQEVSLDYGLFMPYQLPPREFNLKMMLYFSAEDTMLANMFFNQVASSPATSQLCAEPGPSARGSQQLV